MNNSHTIAGSVNLEFSLDFATSNDSKVRDRGTKTVRSGIRDARQTISRLYPQLQQIPQLEAPYFGPASFEYRGTKEEVEEIALALSGIVDIQTRRRLYAIHTYQTADEMKDRKGQRDYVPDKDMIIESAPQEAA